MTANIVKPLTVAIAAASLTGCFSSSSSDGTGSLSLDVTDAPVDSLEEVNVSFTGVTLNPRDGDRVEISLDEEQMEEQPIDLLELQGGNAASLISEEEVPAGEYNWIRLETAENDRHPDMYVVADDGEHDLAVQSARGLQLSGGFTVPQGGSADFTIDFDLRAAITNPEGQDYFLRPSLRMIDNTEVGEIAGDVDSTLISNACDDAEEDNDPGAVYVYEGSDAELVDYHIDEDEDIDQAPLMSASVDKDEQNYVAAFLEEGDYTIAYTCDLDDPDAEDDLDFRGKENVTVVADETQQEDFSYEDE